ncbi:MAG: flagellar hook assembly protein FlgD [Henriciella sp.]
MSEINPVSNAGATSTAASTASTSATNFSEDFDTFLQLLTAQIRNQDPLQPMDSTQFVEQLATFSSLEQQVETNTTLGSIATMIGDLHAVLANEWLGQDVAVASKHVAYEGKPIEFEVNPAFSYDDAVLTVRDSQNQIVWQEQLDADKQRHIWDGSVTDPSAPAQAGIYQMQIDLFSNGQPIASTQAEIISKVTNLANENGQLRLGTDNYMTADLTDVRKLAGQ